jgi:hypothetical protein
MLLKLMMLPRPRSSSPGGQRPDEKKRRPDVAGEHLVVRRHLDLRRRAEHRDPRVVDQDVDVAGRSCPVRKTRLGRDPFV